MRPARKVGASPTLRTCHGIFGGLHVRLVATTVFTSLFAVLVAGPFAAQAKQGGSQSAAVASTPAETEAVLLKRKAELDAQLLEVTKRLYESADKQVHTVLDLGVDTVTPIAPIGVGSVKVIVGLGNIQKAIQSGEPINEAIDVALKAVKVSLPDKYDIAKNSLAALAKAYDSYTRGDYEAALNALTDVAVKESAKIAAKALVTKALAEASKDIVGTAYRSSKDLASAASEYVSFRKLEDAHEQLVREYGDVNRKLLALHSSASQAYQAPKPTLNGSRSVTGPGSSHQPGESVAGPSSASGYPRSSNPNQGIQTPPVDFDPSSMSPQEIEAWQRNQAIVGRETLAGSGGSSIPSGQGQVPPPAQFDPSSMTPQEREAWQRNQAIVARETLGQSVSSANPPSGGSGDLDAAVLFQKWHDEGDRAFQNATERSLFYQNHPELQKYASEAKWMSPATEVDRDLNNGSTSLQFGSGQGDIREQNASQHAGTPNVNFDPSKMTAQEREAWQRNQAAVARETLGRANSPTSVAGNSPNSSKPIQNVGQSVVVQGMYHSEDGGKTWLQNQGTPYENADTRSVQQWSTETFPEIHGPASAGISFGDMATKTSSDGLIATPHVDAQLDPYEPNRHFNKTWTVTNSSNQTAVGGFSEVVFIGGGRFAAKYSAFGNDDYGVFDASTGKPVSDARFHYVQPLGDGYFAVPTTSAGIGMMDIVGPNGKVSVAGAYPSNALVQYMGNGQVKWAVNGNNQYVNVPNFQTGSSLSGATPSPPATGGIYLGGKQESRETKGVEAQVEKDLSEAEIIPKRKKPPQ
jgi:hypothetical protein